MSHEVREGGAVRLAAVVLISVAIGVVLVRTGIVGDLVARATGSRVVRVR
jgi:hypothetical protein